MISHLHLHTQASDDSKSQISRLDEIRFKWMDQAIENCHWLGRLSYDLNSITIVIFHTVVSIIYRAYDLLETERCSNRQSGIPSAAETLTGSLRKSPGLRFSGNLPTDGNLGDEFMAQKNTNTRYLWGGSRVALKSVMVSPAIVAKVILRHLLKKIIKCFEFRYKRNNSYKKPSTVHLGDNDSLRNDIPGVTIPVTLR